MEGSLAWGEARDQTGWEKPMRQYLPTDVLASKIPLQHGCGCKASACILDPI